MCVKSKIKIEVDSSLLFKITKKKIYAMKLSQLIRTPNQNLRTTIYGTQFSSQFFQISNFSLLVESNKRGENTKFQQIIQQKNQKHFRPTSDFITRKVSRFQKNQYRTGPTSQQIFFYFSTKYYHSRLVNYKIFSMLCFYQFSEFVKPSTTH